MTKVCPLCGTSYDDAATFCPADGAALRTVGQTDALVGTVIAERYLVTEKLGEGGMGTVYLGRHVRLPQQVAIKVMRPEMLADPTAIARFNREAANVARIDHERVVRVYDFGETASGQVYLAMEYVPGRTLSAVMDEAGALEPTRALGLLRQVAEGLEAAHRQGIVHRDLKPDNVLVVRDPEGGERCKVLDFGIAKPTGPAADGGALTGTGFILGTPEYMSPEQVLGGELDGRSDVYALALVAFQCLTGALPFDTATPDRGLTARLLHAPRSLQEVRPDVAWGPALQAAFNAGLAREPGERMRSPLALVQALAVALEETVAPEGTAGGATPLDSAPTVVGVPAVSRAEASAAPDSPPAAERPPTVAPGARSAPSPASASPSRRWGVMAAVLVAGVAGGGGWYVLRSPSPEAPVAAPLAVATDGAPGGAPGPASPPPASPATSSPPSLGPSSPSASAPPLPAASSGARPVGGAAPGAPARTASGASGDGAAGSSASARAAAARARLAAMREQLDPTTADDATARRLLPQLRALLAELATPEDSAVGLLRLGEAYLLVEDQPAACASLKRALALTRDGRIASAVSAYRQGVSCPP